MRRSVLTLMLCSGLAFAPPHGHAAAASTKPTSKMTDIQPILIGNRPVTVHPTGFPPVTITPFWRENGNAWGYTLYAVSTPEAEQPDRTTLVATEDADHNGQLLDMVQDIPHTGEDALQTIHFASGHADIALSAATKIPFAKWNGDQEPVPTCPQ